MKSPIRNSNKIRKGFTLIELLVVIAIISLLVAVLMPSLAKSKRIAKRAQCLMQLRNLGTAVALRCEDNDQRLFAIYWLYTGDCWNCELNTQVFVSALAPYMGVTQEQVDIRGPEGKAPFICPEDDNLYWEFALCNRKSTYCWNPMTGQDARDGHVRSMYTTDSKRPDETQLIRCGMQQWHDDPGWFWLWLDYSVDARDNSDFWWDGPYGFLVVE